MFFLYIGFTFNSCRIKQAERLVNGGTFFIFRSTVVTIYASGVNEQVAYQVKVSYKEIKEKAESWLK